MTYSQIEQLFERFQKENPQPRGELFYTNIFTLLVAVVMSAQSTDKGVNKVSEELFKSADTPEKMLALGEERIATHIRTLGLFHSKARNILALSKSLVLCHGGNVPASREELIRLPGVGRKTANVVLNVWWGVPCMPVDTHVLRVAARIGLSDATTPDRMESDLEDRIPAPFMLYAHHWLVLHGRYVCKALRPACKTCLVSEFCLYARDGSHG